MDDILELFIEYINRLNKKHKEEYYKLYSKCDSLIEVCNKALAYNINHPENIELYRREFEELRKEIYLLNKKI